MNEDEYRARMQRVIEESNSPAAKYEAVLNWWWQMKYDEAEAAHRLERELNPTGLKIW
jgi:hypothetical protein